MAGKHSMSDSGSQAATSDLTAGDVNLDVSPPSSSRAAGHPTDCVVTRGVTDLVRGIHDQGKIAAMICHAGLVGISAGIVKGHRARGSLGIKDDLVNAGATWVDQAAFRDGNIVWGRVVADIPAFCRELLAALTSD